MSFYFGISTETVGAAGQRDDFESVAAFVVDNRILVHKVYCLYCNRLANHLADCGCILADYVIPTFCNELASTVVYSLCRLLFLQIGPKRLKYIRHNV